MVVADVVVRVVLVLLVTVFVVVVAVAVVVVVGRIQTPVPEWWYPTHLKL